MDKGDIDAQAEREGKALRKQGQGKLKKRLRRRLEYNQIHFDKLFKD